jgi:hypothetical protein
MNPTTAKQFDRDEVEAAFAHYWQVGCVEEDWVAWTNMFVPDVTYVDHFWGPLHGRDEVLLWIEAVMKGVPEIYTILDWYTIDNEKVTFHCQNRRDNPGADGPRYWDFPGLSVLWYAGDGLFAAEEDFWDRTGARNTSIEYVAACERAGATKPAQRMLRGHWDSADFPDSPAWARTELAPSPSWLKRPELPGITKPRELRELLGRSA